MDGAAFQMNPQIPAPLLVLTALAFAAAPSIAQAQDQILHNGDAYTYGNFGANIGVVDTAIFQSNPSSLRLNYTAGFQNAVFRGTSTFQPSLVDWSEDSLTFDYRTTSAMAVYRVRLHLPAVSNLTIVDVTYASGLSFVADGEWHSVTLTGVDWTSGYNNAVTGGTVLPGNSYSVIVAVQNAVGFGNLNIDNVRVASPIPEPGAYATLLAAGAGLAALRRRRRAWRTIE